MINKVCFDTEELIAVTSSLETYLDNPNAEICGLKFKEEIKQKICNSCLKKLEDYSAFTCFTKQECTMMYAAVMYIAAISEIQGTVLPGISSALEKIEVLADNS